MPAADAKPTAHELLVNLAEHQTHGWKDSHLTSGPLAEKVEAGEHVFIPCGAASLLAQHVLAEHGYEARLAQGIATEWVDDLPEGTPETHVMVEVWESGKWVLYDVDGNVQPVGADGERISATEFFGMPERHYRTLADDPTWNPDDLKFPDYERRIFAEVEAFRDRISATLAIAFEPWAWSFPDTSRSPFVWTSDVYHSMTPHAWGRFLADAPPAPPIPAAPPAPAPAPAPATSTAWPSTPAVASEQRPPCRWHGRQVKRHRIGCRRAKRVLQRYARSGRAKGWKCRQARRVVCGRAPLRIVVRGGHPGDK